MSAADLPDAGAPAAVRLEGIVVRRGGRAILDVPQLELPAGRTTVLFGPNGAGKTTILRLIASLDRPDAGVVTVAGADRNGRGDVAYAFQEAVFLRGSVRANLALGLALRRVQAEVAAARLAAAARDCGILHLLDQEARTLSGGEAQRANLARALALRASLTLLDEPLAGFDGVGRLRFLEELGRLLRDMPGTVVLVTHDREEALRLADHMAIVVAGRVRAAAALTTLLERPPDGETAQLLGYTVLPDPERSAGASEGWAIGVPAGGLHLEKPRAWGERAGRGNEGGRELHFPMVVRGLVRVGLEDRVAGRIGQGTTAADVEAVLPPGTVAPAAGEVVTVTAATWLPIGGD